MSDEIERLIKEGIVELTGYTGESIRAIFREVKTTMIREDLASIPASIGGNAIRGRFSSVVGGRRDGLYYGGEVDEFLHESQRDILRRASLGLRSIANTYLTNICMKYGLKKEDFRLGTCHDTVTLAWYDEVKGDETALVAHTDFGLLTIGMSDAEGLELEDNGRWVKIPSGTPYIHTGQWLQSALKAKGVTDVHPAKHRVVNSNVNRFFMGLFFEPAIESIQDGKNYGDFVRDQFADAYKSEHTEVKLT
jgi:hypothetical protein